MSNEIHQPLLQAGRRRRSVWANVALAISVAFASGIASRPIAAQVQLPGVNLGDTNFEDGFAAPGFLLEEFPDVYVSSTLKDSNGENVPGTNKTTTILTTSHLVYVSNLHLFGAWVAGEVLFPMANVQIKRAQGLDATERGFADPILGPIALQWPPKKIGNGVFVHRAEFAFTIPIGKYSDQRPVNIGNHFVLINPLYAMTYEWKSKFEASARLHYLWSAANTDPYTGFGIRSTQPGQAFHVNYATSYGVTKEFRVGFNGYWLQQLTDHQINGQDVPNSKERTVGLGPGVQFGGNNLWLRVNGYVETDVRNRPAGVRVTFRISKTFPPRGSKP